MPDVEAWLEAYVRTPAGDEEMLAAWASRDGRDAVRPDSSSETGDRGAVPTMTEVQGSAT